MVDIGWESVTFFDQFHELRHVIRACLLGVSISFIEALASPDLCVDAVRMV